MSAAAKRPRLIDRIGSISDGAILRTAFYALLAGTLTVLYIDYTELSEADPAALLGPMQPVLPAFDPTSPETGPGPAVTTDNETLKQPLTIALVGGGVLRLQGTIDPGSAERFATEVEARGEYVKTVSFDSPGGSVQDAMAIGALILVRGFATEVAAGALCASSCPLAFAGGQTIRLPVGGDKPIRIVSQPGLHMKVPFIDSVIRIDKRILDLDSQPQEVTAADQKRLVVDSFARYRIVDPLKFYQTLRYEDAVRSRLGPIIDSAMRRSE